MHILTNSEPVNLGGGLGILEPGDWLMHDLNAFEIALRAPRGTVQIKDHGWKELLNKGNDFPTLIMRSGAIGDLLMLTPALAEWPLYTNSIPHLSLFTHHKPIFEEWPGFISLAPYPFPLARVNEYHEIISLENTMEMDDKHHPTDVFLTALDILGPPRSYKPIYYVTDAEKEATEKHLFKGRPNVAIQPRASIPNRDYPGELWSQVIQTLEKRGWGVLLIGRKGQIPPIPPGVSSPYIRNLAELDLSLRESAAVLSQCDAFCGIDSSFMHFAAALDIPSVSLHGPFRWQTRTAHYPLNTALTGRGECAGCSWHMHNGRMFPPDKPCTKIGLCVVLADLKPDRIVAQIDKLKP